MNTDNYEKHNHSDMKRDLDENNVYDDTLDRNDNYSLP